MNEKGNEGLCARFKGSLFSQQLLQDLLRKFLASGFLSTAHLPSTHIALKATCLKYRLMRVFCSGTISVSLLLFPWPGTHLSWSGPSPAPKPRDSASLPDHGLESQLPLGESKHTMCSHPLIPGGLCLSPLPNLPRIQALLQPTS